MPALLEEHAERACLLELVHRARDGIFGAVHPAVVVIAANHPLIGLGAPRDRGDDVVDRLLRPRRLDLEMHLGGPGAESIGDGKAAAPRLGSERAAERFEQRLRVAVRDRKHGDLRDRLRLGDGKTLCILRRANAWRERIAGIERHVGDAAALHAITRAHRPVRIHGSSRIAVVARIGVDEAAHGAMLGRDLRLDAAPRPTVARDDDGALHRDVVARELVVVGGDAVVHVHERRGDVTVDRIRVVRG